MKRWLLLALLCVLSPLGLRAQVTVSGNLKDAGLTNITSLNSYVRFTLAGYGSNIPRVTGTNAILTPYKDFHPDASGNISGTIQGNDTITIGGNSLPGGTWYQACLFDKGIQFRCATYTITGGSFNLNNATPNTTTPTVPAPTGDNTYLRRDAGNSPLTGALSSTSTISDAGGSHSGPEAFANWNAVISVDGTTYTTCDAAVAAAVTEAGSGKALVIVPSTYAGAACTTIPTNPKVQVWYFNGTDPLVQSGVWFNSVSATPVAAWFRPQVNFTSPAGNALSVYSISRFSGVIPGSSAMDAASHEAQSVGAITSVGAGTKLQGAENVVTLASTGSTWPDVRATTTYVQDTAGNTTNATNVSGLFVPTFVKAGTGTWSTVVGAIFNRQTVGSTNWSMESFGTSGFFPQNSGEKVIIQGDSFSNSNVLEVVDTHASGHTWDIGEMQNVAHLSFRDLTQTGAPAWSFQLTGTNGVEGILAHANTGNRTYTFPDATGPVPITPNLLISATAPSIAAAGCGGGAASIVISNGTAAFKVNVGTTPGSACTLTFPAATTGWNVHCDDITTQSTSVFVQKQTGAESTTSVTITNFNDVAVATAFVGSDVLKCQAVAD